MASGYEMVTAYVQLIPSLKGAESSILSQLTGIDTTRAGSTLGSNLGKGFTRGLAVQRLGAQIETLGGNLSKVGSALTNRVTKPAVGAATAVGGIVTALGFRRLVGIDTARAQFKGLGHDADAVMKQVDKGVTGTALSMAEGAALAVGALATGNLPLSELEDQLKRVANVSAAYGVDASHAGYLLNNVLTKNKVTYGDLSQMVQNQIPILSMLADHYGVTGDEIEKMVQQGKISVEDLNTVLDKNAGEAAESYASSWRGITANIMSNLGRIGASVLEGVFPMAKESLAGFLDALRSDEWQGKAKQVGGAITGIFETIKSGEPSVATLEQMGPRLAESMQPVFDALAIARDAVSRTIERWRDLDDSTKGLVGSFAGVAVIAGPVLSVFGKVTTGAGKLVGAFGGIMTGVARVTGGKGIAGLGATLLRVLGPFGLVTAAVLGLAATSPELQQSLGTLLSVFGDLIARVGEALAPVLVSLAENIFPILISGVEWLAEVMVGLIDGAAGLISWAAESEGVVNGLAAAAALAAGAFIGWKAASAGFALAGMISQLTMGAAAWGRLTIAMLASKAETLGIVALYAKDLVVSLARGAAGIVASTGSWIANTAAMVASRVAMVASRVAMATATAAQWLWNAAMSANPIGIVIGLIAALVAGLVWFFTQTEMGKEIWETVWGAITSFFQAAVDWIMAGLEWLGAFWSGLWEGMGAAASAVWEGITSLISGALASITEGVSSALNWLQAFWASIWQTVSSVASSIWSGISSFITSYVESVRAVIVSILTAISSFWSGAWNTISSGARQIWSGIVNFITSYINSVRNTISNVINGIKSIWSSGWNTVRSTASSVWSGIQSAISGAVNRVRTTISNVINGIKSIWSSGWNSVRDTASNVWGRIQSTFSNGVSTMRSIFTRMGQAITSPFRSAFNGIARLWNGTVGRLSFTVPDWVPGMGGRGWSAPSIPMLAAGGVVTQPTLALVGEAGPEAVFPLDKLSQFLEVEQPGRQGPVSAIVTDESVEALADALERAWQGRGAKVARSSRKGPKYA